MPLAGAAQLHRRSSSAGRPTRQPLTARPDPSGETAARAQPARIDTAGLANQLGTSGYAITLARRCGLGHRRGAAGWGRRGAAGWGRGGAASVAALTEISANLFR